MSMASMPAGIANSWRHSSISSAWKFCAVHQGALLGKNTAAGAISLVSAQPTDTFQAGVDFGALLSRKGFDVSGFVSGPVAENLTGRLAVKLVDEDGYIDNIGTDRKVPSPMGRTRARHSEVSAERAYRHNGQVRIFNAIVNGTQAISDLPAKGNSFQDAVKNTQDPFGTPEKDKTRSFNSAITANFGLGGDNTLTSVSGYSTYTATKYTGAASDNPEDWLSTQLEYFHQFSQELRITSPTGGMFEYIVGAYVDTSKFKTHFDTLYDLLGGAIAGESDMVFDQGSTTFSAFGQGQWNVTDDFDIVGSLRYTSTSKDAKLHQFLISGIAVSPAYGITPANPDKYLSGSRREENLDPSLTLQYHVNPLFDGLFHLQQGLQGGGYVSNSGPVTQATFGFEPEKSRNLELGAKTTLFDGLFVGSVAAFTTKFDDLQVSNYIRALV